WVKTGWLKMNGEWYYVENNKLVSGWKKVGTKWYYLDPEDDNKMAADTDVYSDDNWYYLCSDGAMACNQWVNKGTSEEPDWYYYGANGLGYDGWLLSGGKWYYLNGGYMCADDIIEEDNGDLYYLGKDGAMCTNGWCLYTWRDDSYHEDWIYASSNGKLVKANWVGDYYLRASGTMVRGAYIYNSSNGKYYWVDEETGKYDPSKTTTEKPSVWYIDVIDQKTGKYIDD
ncbi:MAG: hypothetical protein HUJ53_05420, partial [Holdemanella sp.]|nr:hypothetical protein [Holdemanella sp.]